MSFSATWMDLEMIILSEVRQRKKNIMISLICGILKNYTNEFIHKTDSYKTNIWLPKGTVGRGGDKLGVWD